MLCRCSSMFRGMLADMVVIYEGANDKDDMRV